MTEGAQCLQAAQHYHTTSEDAEALRAAVRAMRSILEGYACQAPGLCTVLPSHGSLQDGKVSALSAP